MGFFENLEKLAKRIVNIKPNCPYEQGTGIAQAWYDGYISAVNDMRETIDAAIDEINVEGRT